MISRREVRDGLAAFLRANVSKAQEVFAYQIGDFGGKTPVVYLTSSGSDRKRITYRGVQSVFRINAHICVVYADPTSGWTERDAEDTLDDIEGQIADVLMNGQNVSPLWTSLSYADRSDADTGMIVGGVKYLHEVVSIQVDCME